MRVDEARLKQVRRKDIMERLIAMMKEEEAKLAERRKLRESEGPAAACIDMVDPSACAEDTGITIMPAPDAKGRA
jgi:hypothetical protein